MARQSKAVPYTAVKTGATHDSNRCAADSGFAASTITGPQLGWTAFSSAYPQARSTSCPYPYNCSATKGGQSKIATCCLRRPRHSATPLMSRNDTSFKSSRRPLPLASHCSHDRRSFSTQRPQTCPSKRIVTALSHASTTEIMSTANPSFLGTQSNVRRRQPIVRNWASSLGELFMTDRVPRHRRAVNPCEVHDLCDDNTMTKSLCSHGLDSLADFV